MSNTTTDLQNKLESILNEFEETMEFPLKGKQLENLIHLTNTLRKQINKIQDNDITDDFDGVRLESLQVVIENGIIKETNSERNLLIEVINYDSDDKYNVLVQNGKKAYLTSIQPNVHNFLSTKKINKKSKKSNLSLK